MPRPRYYFSLWVIIVAIAVILYYGLIYFANLTENASLLIAIGFILVLAIILAIFPPRLLNTRGATGRR